MSERNSLSIGFSSCPNDTFIFGALATGKLNTNLNFETFIGDIDELNRKATNGELDIIKISAFAYLNIWKDYVILTSGSALAKGDGPIIVAREKLSPEDISYMSMAIPGKQTTANLLLELTGMHKGPRVEMIFHEIMPAVKEKSVDAGVLIHEGRWTFHQFGLKQVMDLGKFWENKTGLPLPLGTIVIRRSMDRKTIEKVNELIVQSINYARQNREKIWPFIEKHAQEMDYDIINKHIEAFVNEFSINLDSKGKEAIRCLLELACDKLKLQKPDQPIFWDEI